MERFINCKVMGGASAGKNFTATYIIVISRMNNLFVSWLSSLLYIHDTTQDL